MRYSQKSLEEAKLENNQDNSVNSQDAIIVGNYMGNFDLQGTNDQNYFSIKGN